MYIHVYNFVLYNICTAVGYCAVKPCMLDIPLFLYTIFHFPFADVLLSTRYFFQVRIRITSFYYTNFCIHESSRTHQGNFNHSYLRLACFTPRATSRARAPTRAHARSHKHNLSFTRKVLSNKLFAITCN